MLYVSQFTKNCIKKMIYIIINNVTYEIIAYTIVTNNMSDCLNIDEIIDARIECAIDDELINDDDYHVEYCNNNDIIKYLKLI